MCFEVSETVMMTGIFGGLMDLSQDEICKKAKNEYDGGKVCKITQARRGVKKVKTEEDKSRKKEWVKKKNQNLQH